MNKYHVTYYYLASGMEGVPQTGDYGHIEAESKDRAIRKVLKSKFPDERADWDWISGCMTAKLVKK